jgi:hypothetical protein
MPGRLRSWVIGLAASIALLAGPVSAARAVTALSVTGIFTDSAFHTIDGASSVKVAGHYAYVAGYLANTLTVLDVSDPAHMVELGSVTSLSMSGATGVDEVGNYAYVTSKNTHSLTIVDVSTPTQPTVVGTVQDTNRLNGAYTVQVVGNYAYVAAQGCVPQGCTAAGGNALTIVDVSDPTQPHVVGTVTDPVATKHLDSVVVKGTKAYGVAFYSSTFTVFDVSDPTHPKILGSTTNATTLNHGSDVDVQGNYAYVVNQNNPGRLTVVDISNPASPTVRGSVSSSSALNNAYALQVSGSYAYVAARNNNALTVVNISNPAAPVITDTLSNITALGTALEVSLQRGQAFVAAYCSGPCSTATSSAVSAVNIGAYGPAQDLTPPQTSIDSGPSAFTQSTSANFAVSTNEAGSTLECRFDGGVWRSCTSSPQYTDLADGGHLLEVAATDPAGNLDPTPATWAWTVDTHPPDTSIDSGPSGVTSSTSASFAFSSSEAGSSFACTLDGANVPCAPAGGYQALAEGSHTFTVAATDQAGNADPTPASATWVVDAHPPVTSVDSALPAFSNSGNTTIAFHANESDVTFACTLDGTSAPCSSPVSYSGLPDGSHTFQVAATDAAGDVEAAPQSVTWTVDTQAPDSSIDSGPSGATNATSASFAFSSSEAGSTFACTLDGANVPCAPAGGYQGLADGSHTFTVAATDQAGNTDPTPASRTWTVDTQAPVTTMDSAPPPAFSNSKSISLTFHANESGATFSCTLDAVSAPCSSPTTYSGLVDGSHTVKVTATDAAGNVEASPPRLTWTVDTVAPNTSIVATPPKTTTSTTATFRFWTNETGATFSCTLDGVTAPCTYIQTFTGLAVGTHTLKVAAIDRAGNRDATPATYSWTIAPTLTGATQGAATGSLLVLGPGRRPQLRLGKDGTLVFRLGPQPAGSSGTVHLRLALKRGSKNVASAHFRVAANRTSRIELRLRASVLKQLPRKVSAVVAVTFGNAEGGRSTVRYRFILRR